MMTIKKNGKQYSWEYWICENGKRCWAVGMNLKQAKTDLREVKASPSYSGRKDGTWSLKKQLLPIGGGRPLWFVV